MVQGLVPDVTEVRHEKERHSMFVGKATEILHGKLSGVSLHLMDEHWPRNYGIDATS
jgi:hypothetical protein